MRNASLKKEVFDKNLFSPLPVALVGAVVNGKPNYLVIGYMCPFDFGRYLFFSLYKKRYTRIGIHETQTFSVNVPSENLVNEVRICGSKSGRNFDKSKLFETFYGELKTAPMIKQCPINIECEIAQILDYEQNDGVIGRVVNSYINRDCLTNGQLDMQKVHPILWASGGDNNYYQLGNRIHQEEK
ncbi:MAG: flavin reductase family protein [Candidatus Thorarchaeota archaeon]